MQALIDIAVVNAVVAAALTVVAWAAARWVRRPALTHALCLLVLLKLVTPPLFVLQLPAPLSSYEVFSKLEAFRAPGAGWAGLDKLAPFVWFVGALVWFAIQLRLASRLRATIDCATPAPSQVAEAAARIACQMGLRRHPPVRVLSAIHSPMLCGFGSGVRIVLPAAVLERLDPAAQEAILAHELAHYARRDHWVRIVEVIATGLFWWHPAVWWSRRQIELSEEQCCDELVIRHSVGHKQTYAEAILDVVDWLAEGRRTASCALSSAFGGRASLSLSARLHHLLDIDAPPRPSTSGAPLATLFAALCLLVHPVIEVTSTGGLGSPTGSGTSNGGVASSNAATLRAEVDEEPPIWATAAPPGSDYAVSVREGFRCEIVERSTGRVRRLERRQVTCIAFVAEGSSIVVGDLDGTISLINASTGQKQLELVSRSSPIRSLDVDLANDRIAATDDKGTVVIASLASDGASAEWTYDAPVRCVRFAPDGQQLAVAIGSWRDSSPGRVEIVDVTSRAVIQQWAAPRPLGAVRYISPNILLTADWAGVVDCRRVSDGQKLGSSSVSKEIVSVEAFSPHADALAPMARQFDVVMRRDFIW